ncbi:hypothetical protein pipiens_003568 [Culex pipiens pipiens]|uniref:Uncharacterized protein n=1 Tax=Culex pipiens pipiens TaxID=38569 RepID=A0ABD1CY91_CULPP
MGFGSRVQMMVKKVCSYKVISLMHKLKAAKAVHQHSVLDVWDSVRYMRLVDWLEATGQYIQVNLELHNTFKADDLGKHGRIVATAGEMSDYDNDRNNGSGCSERGEKSSESCSKERSAYKRAHDH